MSVTCMSHDLRLLCLFCRSGLISCNQTAFINRGLATDWGREGGGWSLILYKISYQLSWYSDCYFTTVYINTGTVTHCEHMKVVWWQFALAHSKCISSWFICLQQMHLRNLERERERENKKIASFQRLYIVLHKKHYVSNKFFSY